MYYVRGRMILCYPLSTSPPSLPSFRSIEVVGRLDRPAPPSRCARGPSVVAGCFILAREPTLSTVVSSLTHARLFSLPTMEQLPAGIQSQISGMQGGQMSSDQARQLQAQQQQQAEEAGQRQQMLLAVLDNAARARLKSVALVKPERAAQLENHILSLAQSGKVQGQLGEETIVGMLKQMSDQDSKKAAVKVNFKRRSTGWSDDEDEPDDY